MNNRGMNDNYYSKMIFQRVEPPWLLRVKKTA